MSYDYKYVVLSQKTDKLLKVLCHHQTPKVMPKSINYPTDADPCHFYVASPLSLGLTLMFQIRVSHWVEASRELAPWPNTLSCWARKFGKSHVYYNPLKISCHRRTLKVTFLPCVFLASSYHSAHQVFVWGFLSYVFFVMQTEKEVTEFIKDSKRTRMKYPPMNRVQRSIV